MKVPTSRLLALLLLALAGTLYFIRLSGTDLKEPNEPISAQAAREMMQRGDWVLPTVNGEPYPDKPPLLFWGIRLASLGSGEVTETTARLPSAIAATALVLAVFLLGRRALGARGAFLAAATLAVSNLFVEQARYVQHDMLLCLGVTVATLVLFRLKDGDAPSGAWLLLSASALAFATLDKGPVGLVLPALILAVAAIVERTFFRRLGHLLGAGFLGMIPILLYYFILARHSGPGLLETFLFRHNLERFTSGFDHAQPWWYFLVHAPVDLLPCTLLLPAAACLRSQDPERRRFHRRLWIWILVTLIFFSFSASKRPVYMLPALPPMALLCGAVLERLARGKAANRVRRLTAAGEGTAMAALGLAGLAAPVLAWRRAPALLPASYFMAGLAMAGAALGLTLLFRRDVSASHHCLLASLVAVWLSAIVWVLPAANPILSPRIFSETIARKVPAGEPLQTFGLYRFRCGYIFYTRRLMPRLRDREALEAYLRSDRRVFCILSREKFNRLGGSLAAPAYVLAEGGAGSRKDVLISNRPPGPESPSRPAPLDRAPASPGPAARTGTGT